MREHCEIIIPTFMSLLITSAGLFFVYLGVSQGSQAIVLFKDNPAIPNIIGVITGVGISATFFGLDKLVTNLNDYGHDQKIQSSIEEIKTGINSLQGSFFVGRPTDETIEIARHNKIEQIKLELD